ncbi:ricin-type beta-trefoil lectin domain protein [Kitasatospora sp. NA04385]|uniref:ricin-type beta-trefoil lectin domain protein n=1 Tax=Kitasatospora sp. NA04385 TaxID=2742135 RepID=UPI00159141AD|nr:ricin-type beta-trefoil lectin domain protein [Kitasatospora sp. NA04385]QKW22369.1 ricin-type beta-trefoil lectin domain protein [Kitasatospora sp. NA04385]
MDRHLPPRPRHAPSRTPRRPWARLALALAIGCLAADIAATPAPAAADTGTGGSDGWVLSTTDTTTDYAPAFVGNGYLASRVPAAGAGYSDGKVPVQSELAGLYALPQGQRELRAGLPTWTTLGFGRDDGNGGVYGVPAPRPCTFDQLCPAGHGQISGGAFVEDTHAGSTTGSYLAGLNTHDAPTVGARDVIPILDAPGGAATLAVRYSNGSGGPQTVHLTVNGVPQQVNAPATPDWDSWALLTVPTTLNAGTNTVEITVAQGDTARVNVDYVSAYPAGAPLPTGGNLKNGATGDYRQALDLRTGLLTTSFDWTSPEGDRTTFTYEVNANRAHAHLGTVTIRAVPHWSGTAAAVDGFDERGLSDASVNGTQVDGAHATLSQSLVSDGDLVTAALHSALRVDGATVPSTPVTGPGGTTSGQRATFPVTAGRTYEVTKFVGAASSVDTDRPLAEATPQQAAADAAAAGAAAGYRQALAANSAAWAELWQSTISVPGDTAMTAQIRASMFYLLAGVRSDVTWSAAPGGLSTHGSAGYGGHVFWDMETWMYPALLAQHPDIAKAANTYRQKLLPQAEANAASLSTPSQPIKGAKFPWESALTGNDATPLDSLTGPLEIHINSDIALAQWQYYQATGDTDWLRDKAWPVLKGIADYWATRAVPDSSGNYHINDVIPPDEYNGDIDDSVYTNASAQAALRIAVQAAGIVKQPADPAWNTVADGLTILVDTANDRHVEYQGYDGRGTKQADVTMLQYPWAVPMAPSTAQNDLDYYSRRTDPNGPSMTDAIATIDAAALGSPGCTAYNHLRDSVDPFLGAPFNQFHEARTGGTFTFTTGSGGYLQQFLYGFTGLRWGTDAVTVDPFLPAQLPGDDVTGLKWHGSTFDVSVGQQDTTVTVRSGPALSVRDRSGAVHQVAAGSTLHLPTRHPAATTGPTGCADRTPTGPITGAASARCVDLPDAADADWTQVQLYDCNNTPAQTWTLPGDHTVRAMGKCLDVRFGSDANGTPVQLYTCNGTPAQQWTYDPDTSRLKSHGKCLDAAGAETGNGTRLQLWDCVTGAGQQQWKIPTAS